MAYRTHLYQNLVIEAHNCKACPDMLCERTFLNIHNGNLNAEIMFIGEAASMGRDQNGYPTPMANSPSGDNFDESLKAASLSRYDVFTTNAVLHTPILPGTQKSGPASKEQATICGEKFIKPLIKLVNPKLVVTLGARAFEYIKYIEDHGRSFHNSVKIPFEWYGRIVYPLYHPSPMSQRTLDQQKEDFKDMVKVLSELKGK